MGLILSEPITNVVKISKNIGQNVRLRRRNSLKSPKIEAKERRSRQMANGSRRKDKKKKKSQAEGKNMGRKTVFWLGASVFSILGLGPVLLRSSCSFE
jgi:hypothetical protein